MAKLIRTADSGPIIPFCGTIQKKLGRDTGRFGTFEFADYEYGSDFAFNHEYDGEYQIRHCVDGRQSVKMRFKNRVGNDPTPGRLASQAKLRAGVLAWRALTSSQQEVYNIRAKGKRLTGNNLFIKEYLLS